jgi:hypothetical protein
MTELVKSIGFGTSSIVGRRITSVARSDPQVEAAGIEPAQDFNRIL